jgi:uncharacterized membrane protein YbhN (UPF0104 family)
MKAIKKIGQIIIYSLTIYFIGKIFYQNLPTIRNHLADLNFFYFLLAIILFSLSFWLLALAWHRLINHFAKINFSTASWLYFKSQILRYIPGNVWGLGARVYFFSQAGLQKSQSIFSLLYESVLLVFSGILTYFIFHFSLSPPVYLDVLMLIIGLILLISIIMPKLYQTPAKVFFKGELTPPLVSWSNALIFIFIYLIYWLICGLGFYFIIISLTEFSLAKLFSGLAIYAVSWVLGYISLITPSGLGVREFSTVWLLSSFITVPLATVAAILGRLVFTLGELISLSLSFLSCKKISDNRDRSRNN